MRKSDPAITATKAIPAVQEKPIQIDRLVTGSVLITDPWGGELMRLLVVVLDAGWIALPTSACIGGNQWEFRSQVGASVSFAGGLWMEGDIIGLWQLETVEGYEGPPLKPWEAAVPLQWLSLQSGRRFESVKVTPLTEPGLFIQCQLPEFISGPGLFIQNNQVVGLTFGKEADGGFLLAENLDVFETYESTVADFYARTFAGGREEQFAMGLAMAEDRPVMERLKVLAGAFRLEPKLAIQDTPSYLNEAEIIRHLRFLVSQARNKDLAGQLFELFSVPVLRDINDLDLALDIVQAAVLGRGYEHAIQLTADLTDFFQEPAGHQAPSLLSLRLTLYQQFLHSRLEDGEIENGWQVFKEAKGVFPDDPVIHLIGVELLLADGNWQEAERLLYMMEYPRDLAEKVKRLGARISELKGQEGKIVIRFHPGSRLIPVTVLLNNTLEHNFFVDTGASFVTIPYDTATELGIAIDENSPRHHVSTAGGMIVARETTISSIELGGWVVEDVKALVIDIPAHPAAGLLGLNFLSRFRMDLDTNQGVLLLSPK